MRILVRLLTVLASGVVPIASAMDLIEVYDLAVVNDPAFLEAKARRDSDQESRPQAIANLLPSLSVSGSTRTTRLHNKKVSFERVGADKTSNFFTHRIGLDLRQPVFHKDFWVQLDQSDNQIVQADAEYAATKQELIVRTTNAYLDVLLANDTLVFATAEKLALARQLEQAQQRFNVGLIAITDVLEAQAGYDKAVADEIQAENDLDNRKEELREIIGDSPVDLAGLGDELPLLKPDPENIEEWSKLAENLNLDIIARKNEAERARKQIEFERSGHYPTVDIVGRYDYQDDTGFSRRGDQASIGLELNFPLFQGGAVNSRSRQAQFDFAAAQQGLAAERRSVIRQVKDSYRGVISTIGQVNAREATVKSSKSAVEATEAGFEVGTRTMVDVVAEQRNLFRSKRDHAETRYDYIKNWLRLKQATSDLSREDLEKFNRLLTN